MLVMGPSPASTADLQMITVKFRLFVVEGAGEFPFDMLRSDHCWPATSVDAHNMRAQIRRRRLTLCTYAHNGRSGEPNEARWTSFDWKVVSQF
jgi:hypothetical protein